MDIFKKDYAGVFRNKFVLDSKYIPETLIARDQQIMDVAHVIRDVFYGGVLGNTIIFGKSGSGKTVVVRYVLAQLENAEEYKNTNVVSVFVNCATHNTPRRVLLEILQTLDPTTEFKRGLATGEYYTALWQVLNTQDTSLVLALDEIDKLSDLTLLYVLSRAGENQYTNYKNSIGVIGISNDIFFRERFSQAIYSSFGHQFFVFPPYDVGQIMQILGARVEGAFYPNTLRCDVLPLCAAFAAREHGDARIALNLLHKAGEFAEEEHAMEVHEHHVRLGYELQNDDELVKISNTLPLHSKIVLFNIANLTKDRAAIPTGAVNTAYHLFCKQTGCNELCRSTVSRLISELETIGFIDAPTYNAGNRGRTRNITLLVDRERITAALTADPMFSEWA